MSSVFLQSSSSTHSLKNNAVQLQLTARATITPHNRTASHGK
ncbi:Uncharacterized protein APZ42_021060 [Daphnia magna]|uniref:Uncharacterized protein n=1 Tax=Daphnia magna TaxID=35525 RepID=A0A164WYP4_9CRUS|nr:Uncharacterized protein APZ42_021060 [Daphnia magna]